MVKYDKHHCGLCDKPWKYYVSFTTRVGKERREGTATTQVWGCEEHWNKILVRVMRTIEGIKSAKTAIDVLEEFRRGMGGGA